MVLRHRPSFRMRHGDHATHRWYLRTCVSRRTSQIKMALLLLGRESVRVHQSFGLGFLRPVFTTTLPTRNTVTIPPTIRVAHQHCLMKHQRYLDYLHTQRVARETLVCTSTCCGGFLRRGQKTDLASRDAPSLPLHGPSPPTPDPGLTR